MLNGHPFDAVAAADAVLVDEVDDAVRVLHDRAGRRAGLQAARIGAMHAAVLADQPFQVLRLRIDPFGEAHHREDVRRQIERIVVDAVVDADLARACRSTRGTPTWQALQPMHFETSISLATGVSCRAGGGTRRGRPADEIAPRTEGCVLTVSAVVAGWEARDAKCHALASLCHRPGNGLDIDQERLVFRRLDIGVTDIGRERVRAEALLRRADEAPVQRDADDMHRSCRRRSAA